MVFLCNIHKKAAHSDIMIGKCHQLTPFNNFIELVAYLKSEAHDEHVLPAVGAVGIPLMDVCRLLPILPL